MYGDFDTLRTVVLFLISEVTGPRWWVCEYMHMCVHACMSICPSVWFLFMSVCVQVHSISLKTCAHENHARAHDPTASGNPSSWGRICVMQAYTIFNTTGANSWGSLGVYVNTYTAYCLRAVYSDFHILPRFKKLNTLASVLRLALLLGFIPFLLFDKNVY